MLHKSYVAGFKTAKDAKGKPTGEVEAIVSVFNNVDIVGDRVVPGAFLDDLEQWKSSGDPLPMIFSHDWSNPMSMIGSWDPAKAQEVEASDGHPAGLKLIGKVDIDEGNPVADQVYKLMSSRRVKEMSFAYNVDDEGKGDDGANELRKLSIIEAGPTLRGANQETVLLAAKAMGKAEALEEIKIEQIKARLDVLEKRFEKDPEPEPEPEVKTAPDTSLLLRLIAADI